MAENSVITFTSTIEKFPHKGGWHFVRLTSDILRDLREVAGKNGNVPILATIGKTSWPTTSMSMGDQQWFFAVSAKVRKSEHINEGDTVEVRIIPDLDRLNTL